MMILQNQGLFEAQMEAGLRLGGRLDALIAQWSEEAAEGAKTGCPVSQALSSVPMTLEVTFTE